MKKLLEEVKKQLVISGYDCSEQNYEMNCDNECDEEDEEYLVGREYVDNLKCYRLKKESFVEHMCEAISQWICDGEPYHYIDECFTIDEYLDIEYDIINDLLWEGVKQFIKDTY